MVIDKFLNKKLQPTLREFITWSKDMIDYFKRKWDEMENEMEDVMEVNNGTTKITKDNEISGIKGRVMNDDSYRIKIGVCDMLETRLKSNKLQKAYDRVFQRWDWVSNMQECSKGCRIVVANDGIDRRSLWKELIKEKRYVNGKPWCIAGDMNVTLKIEIEDICKTGLHFTLTKNLQKTKDGDMTGILKKLDRVMTNEEFIKKFANAHAKFLPYIISDYTPSFLCIPTSVKKKAKALRFSNYLTDKQEFLHIVKDKWSADIHGYPYTHILRNTKANLVKEFYEAEEDEEKFLFQQAKIKWLSDKDKNNSYFHKVLKGRNNRSKILSLKDKNGVNYKNDQIPHLFLKHFENFLGKAQLVQDIEDCSTLFQRRVNEEVALNMIVDVSDIEIKNAIFDIEDTKAPGPDDFTTVFFKKAWAIVGTDVCKAVREFFNSGRMLGEINATLISLIPNVQIPSNLTEFRLIACCNVLYKCINKVITNRIKLVLGSLVSSNQSAFIPGRQIRDNIMLTQELMKGYKRKRGPKRVAFKIDLQKAYDTVNCFPVGFTINVIWGINENELVVLWVGKAGLSFEDMEVTYVTLSIHTYNGNVFSYAAKTIEKDLKFQYHFGCKSLKLVNVCFADDLLVMCHGDTSSVEVIKRALDEFSASSGLLPNSSKST
ncbi:RNA-directed DNA polymerase, eukaryota, reverse transcriptase zinc-binding domain protein [Tanacetum coccineum]